MDTRHENSPSTPPGHDSSLDAGPRTTATQNALVDALVDAHVLTAADRFRLTHVHESEGGWVGRLALTYGYCTRLELYRTWASVLQLEFVNLVTQPCDETLFSRLNSASMLADRWVPWRLSDDGTTLRVAVASPDTTVPEGELDKLGVTKVAYVLTTDWDLLQAVSSSAGEEIAYDAAERLANEQPHFSASHGPSRAQKLGLLAIALAMIAVMAWNHFVGLDILLTVLNVYFDASVLTKVILTLVGMREVRRQEETRLQRLIDGDGVIQRRVASADLPTYSILVPCYHEANVIPQILRNLEQLDYPRSKLQVLLLLEEDDLESLAAAKATKTADYMRIVVVPDGTPRTKARACNVGLSLATGEFLVIYDAEDRPEPSQLREVVDSFDELGPRFVCLQARLNYFNAHQNFLTRMFTIEYSLWFDYLLLGVEKLRIPFPLGGTSNHFRTEALRELGGWDPYNVTEDADLGIRAMARGYDVGAIESTTWEEACPEVRAWIRQRTRWIKGYMVTATVHSRSLRELRRTTGWRGLASMVLFIAGTPATFLINPIVLAWGAYGIFGLPLPNFHSLNVVTLFNTISLIFGNVAIIAISLQSVRRRKQWSLFGYAFLNPVFWLLHSLAAWRALWQLIRTPSEWEKTPHGLSSHFDSGHGRGDGALR